MWKNLHNKMRRYTFSGEAKVGSFLYPPPEPAAIVIYDDGGGIVEAYKDAVMRYASADRPVKVVGSCRSACTLVLAYTNACVYPTAVFKWHMAYNSYDSSILYPDVTSEMINWMPFAIQNHLRKNVKKDYNNGATMTGAELIGYGVKECDISVNNSANSANDNTSKDAVPNQPYDLAKKDEEFKKYYNQIRLWSKTQNGGRVAYKEKCNSNSCSDIIAYYDREQRYVEVHVNQSNNDKWVCRIRWGYEQKGTCTNWYDQRVISTSFGEPLFELSIF